MSWYFVSPKVVNRTVMMNKPQDLARMSKKIARRTNGDEPVSVLRNIKEPDSQHLIQHLAIVRGKWNQQRFYNVASRLERYAQPVEIALTLPQQRGKWCSRQ